MTLVLFVPVLLLTAACIVVFGPRGTEHARAKMAAYPVAAAFLGAVATLYVVTTGGPVSARFYDLSSVASFAIPIGFYVDRLSAVMMTLITGVSVIIYNYSLGYMYQDRHARRYLAMICLTDFVLICMVSSANLMMLFLFWQVLSYLCMCLRTIMPMRERWAARSRPLRCCAWLIRPFWPALRSPISCMGRWNIKSSFSEPPISRSCCPCGPAWR